MTNRLTFCAVAITAATALILSGCSASGGSGSKDPIVIGSVNTKSGPATFPEASLAAAAVFDAANAAGGIDGRKIAYTALDDKGDPATALASARELVGSDRAVAMAGSASLIECQINSKYYEQQKILSVPGIGVDTGCFDSPNISPTNIGPYNDLALSLYYGSEILHLKNICVLLEIAGSTRPAYQAAIDRWMKITGDKPLYIDDTVPVGASDYTPYIIKAKSAGCRTLAINAIEPDAIGQVKAANAQGWNDVSWLYLTSIYSENFAAAVNNAGAGIFVPAEFYPFTDSASPANKDWLALMTENKIPLTSFSQGGFLAATYLVQVLKGIKGPITRESVTAALHKLGSIDNPMAGSPWTFGTAKKHNGNTTAWPITLASGTNKWQLSGTATISLPAK